MRRGCPQVDLLLVVVVAGVVLMLWPLLQSQQQAREWAMKALRRECQQQGLQLLDDTVELSRTRLRLRKGRFLTDRGFTFEFSSTGDDRYCGELHLTGLRIMSLQLEPHRI